jgi:MFS family permease
MLPLFFAELTIWLGFGAMLPILPIYFVQHGVDLPMLGVVVAAWPAARLVSEPVFGWFADRWSRKAMMTAGLVAAAVVAVLPLVWVGPFAFVAARALAGLAAAVYDPAARGYLMDANPPDRQGETFGLYGAAQTAGFMLGPAVGGLVAAASGEPTIVFWVAGIALAISALLVAVRVHEVPHVHHLRGTTAEVVAQLPAQVAAAQAAQTPGEAPAASRMLTGLLVAAMVFNAGAFVAGGIYEVVWSLYLTSLGAGLDAIGLTFATFSLPVLLLSPFVGRFVDREGGFIALVVGLGGIAICGVLYPLVPAVWWMAVMGLVEGTAFALASPALYLLVARSSPPGRSSFAQGLFGSAGMLGTIGASLLAGVLAEIDLRYPFFAACGLVGFALLVGLAIGRRPLWLIMQPAHLDPGAPETVAAGEAAS